MDFSNITLGRKQSLELPTLNDIDLDNIEKVNSEMKKVISKYKSMASGVEMAAKGIELLNGDILFLSKQFFGETRKYRQEHISRKRFIKLMMSVGYSRNTASEMANGMANWSSYAYAWIWFCKLFKIIGEEDAFMNKGYREIYERLQRSNG